MFRADDLFWVGLFQELVEVLDVAAAYRSSNWRIDNVNIVILLKRFHQDIVQEVTVAQLRIR